MEHKSRFLEKLTQEDGTSHNIIVLHEFTFEGTGLMEEGKCSWDSSRFTGYMCACDCVYVYTHMYAFVYMNMYIWVYKRACAQASVFMFVHVSMYVGVAIWPWRAKVCGHTCSLLDAGYPRWAGSVQLGSITSSDAWVLGLSGETCSISVPSEHWLGEP